VTVHSTRERWLWIAAGTLLLLIYGSTYYVRILLDRLSERGWLGSSVMAVFAVTVAVLLVVLVRARPGPLEMGLLAVAAVVYLMLLTRMELPQERIHFVQYGVFSGLVYAALKDRWQGRRPGSLFSVRSAELWAVVLTAAAGWLDEGIQYLVPNRYYDLRDVVFNAIAGALPVGVVALRERIRQNRIME
jgi:VanZ family protein